LLNIHESSAPQAHASSNTATPAAPAEQLAVRVASAVQNEQRSVTVELRPESLGRVEVRLNFHDDKSVSVQMTMDRHETYTAFRENRAGLTQQLSQAGINLGSSSLDLRFNQQGHQQQQQQSGGNTGQNFAGAKLMAPIDETDADANTTADANTRPSGNSLIDIDA
jgi:flagellar hook-length control protein FliK